jgi:hypothetical protein
MCSEAAGETAKGRLIGTVRFVRISALGALAAGTVRADRERDSGERRFIADEMLQLIERPAMQNDLLRQPGLDPTAHAREFFEHHSAVRALVFRDGLLADAVVDTLANRASRPLLTWEPLNISLSESVRMLVMPMSRAEVVVGSARIGRVPANNEVDVEIADAFMHEDPRGRLLPLSR